MKNSDENGRLGVVWVFDRPSLKQPMWVAVAQLVGDAVVCKVDCVSVGLLRNR